MAGTLFVVATPIGNLDDITIRALRILKEVQLIAAEDTRRTAKLLAHYGITTTTTSFHEHNRAARTGRILARLKAGDSVALVSDAGTPAVADPGAELVADARREGIAVEPIPGPNAAVAALSASGLSGGTFTFLGFPPTRSQDRRLWFERVTRCNGVAIFYEAPHRIAGTLQDLREQLGDVKLGLARELTKLHQEFAIRPISEWLAGALREQGEFVGLIDIGDLTEKGRWEPPALSDIAEEFSRLTYGRATTKRHAIAQLSRKYGLTPNSIYAAIEARRKSGL